MTNSSAGLACCTNREKVMLLLRYRSTTQSGIVILWQKPTAIDFPYNIAMVVPRYSVHDHPSDKCANN
jgi:hypothetical protein